MAETVLASLEQLQKIAAKNKEISDNLTGRLETIEKVGPQANVLEGVKVNGKALAIVQKMVDILVTTGAADGTITPYTPLHALDAIMIKLIFINLHFCLLMLHVLSLLRQVHRQQQCS